jgi:hypothetical protein
MKFDDTYADGDFQRRMQEAKNEWMDELASREPDLTVDGLRGTLMSRVLAMLGLR